MPGAARLSDVCTGHFACSPRPNDQASDNVMINGRGAHRMTDHWTVHCSHDGSLSQGSSSVIVNNLNLGRCGDPVTCGSFVATCSTNVIIN